MHQTTIRFAPELWAAPKRKAALVGVSIAHYVRHLHLADRIESKFSSTEAVRAQGRLAREHAKRLRAEADALRAKGQARRSAAVENGSHLRLLAPNRAGQAQGG